MARALARSSQSLFDFVEIFFRHGFANWHGGRYIYDACERMDRHPFLLEITGRGFWKSSRFYAEIAQQAFTTKKHAKMFYFSFNQRQSRTHLKELKDAVNNILTKIPALREVVVDNKPTAESVVDYSNAFGGRVEAQAFGFGESFRGLHTDETIYIDDPLADPTNKLDPLLIRRANDVFITRVLPIINPVPGAKMRIGGTPQTDQDFFAQPELMSRFAQFHLPAIMDGKSIWPERFSMDELDMFRRSMGDKRFRQEFMAEPIVSVDAYIDAEILDKRLVADPNYEIDPNRDVIVVGYDPAEKRHSSHFTAYVVDEENYRYVQVLSKFWDHTPYADQLAWIYEWCQRNDVRAGFVDGSGPMSLIHMTGRLHPCFETITFTRNRKHGMIAEFDAKLTNEIVDLLPDERQRKHILSVTGALDSIETNDGDGKIGHADACWSNCLALLALERPDWLLKRNEDMG